MVVPLLVMATPVSAAARVLFVLVSATFMANMALHDPPFVTRLTEVLTPDFQHRIQILNSMLNLAILAGWSAVLVWGQRWCAEPSAPRAERT
jgi:hypothetical protein